MITKKTIWLIYDGECPICRPTANALKIKQAVGTLNLLDARKAHPILSELKKAGLDIDKGMVVKFEDRLYHGADAQHLLALIGTTHDWFNRINVWLFRSKPIAKIIYPVLRAVRNILLKYNKIAKLNNLGKSDEP
jgi:predicted DCC family thiol-disulfide oxidoreductase YuxK